jgi:hypothetical protein
MNRCRDVAQPLVLPFILSLVALAALPFSRAVPDEPAREAASAAALVQELTDDFNSATIDAAKWRTTSKNDFSESVIDLVPIKGNEKNVRLRLRCAIMNTDDRTVKFLGLVTQKLLDLSGRRQLELDFDWNNQANGCYLTAGVYLCPTLTTGNPEDEPQWVRLQYVGVPPGRNARAAIWLKDGIRLRCLYDEGWPAKQRVGRLVAQPHVELRLDDGRLTFVEDGKTLFASGQEKLSFEAVHLYLQMSSHSNYPAREIFFDNIAFSLGESRSASENGQKPR